MDWLAWAALAFLIGVLVLISWPRVICPLRREFSWRTLASRTGLRHRQRRVLGLPRPGRVTGTYQGYECSLSTYRALDIEARMSVVLALENRAQRAVSVLWRQHADPPFQLLQSQPNGFADELFAVEGLGQRLSDAAQGLRSNSFHLELSGHMLKFEQRLQALCPYGGEQYVASLQALLETLCHVANAIEQLPRNSAS